MAEHDNFGSFIVGFLAGAVAGAVATILYTPQSGEETRGALHDKTETILQKANVSVDDAYKQAESAANTAREKFQNLATATKDKAESLSRRGQVILEERMGNLKNSNTDSDSSDEIPMQNENNTDSAQKAE